MVFVSAAVVEKDSLRRAVHQALADSVRRHHDCLADISDETRYALETNEIKYNVRIETAVKSFDVECGCEKTRSELIAVRLAPSHSRRRHNGEASADVPRWRRRGYRGTVLVCLNVCFCSIGLWILPPTQGLLS
jgi:hypothetical protein